MPASAMAPLLKAANANGTALAGVVCLGWEDAQAYVAAAEAVNCPLILQAGPGARAHMPVAVWGAMFRALAEQASVPIVSHLDHGQSAEDCFAGIDAGFTSVMFDGSAMPLAENIAITQRVVERAKAAGVSVEGEVGFVGYAGDERGTQASRMTSPLEAAEFAQETHVSALAISVGNVHLQTEPTDGINYDALTAVEAETGSLPLVLHGGSGIPDADRRRLARDTAVAKFNIGTELRQTFGEALRESVRTQSEVFDRIKLLNATKPALQARAEQVLRGLS